MKKLITILLILFSIQGFSQTKLRRNIIEADSLTVNYNVNSDLTPSLDTTYSLGTSAKRWKYINGESLVVGGDTISSSLSLSGIRDTLQFHRDSLILAFDTLSSHNSRINLNVDSIAAHNLRILANLDSINGLISIDDISYDSDGWQRYYSAESIVDSVFMGDSTLYMSTMSGATHLGTLQEHFAHSSSPYIALGGGITDNLDGTITVAAAEAFIKTSNQLDASYKGVVIPQAILTPFDENVNTVYIDHNGGIPVFKIKISQVLYFYQNWDESPFASVTRAGTVLHIANYKDAGTNHDFKMILKDANTYIVDFWFGISPTDEGTLHFSATTGYVYVTNIPTLVSAFNTLTGDTFTYIYYNGTSWVRTLAQSTLDNLQWNNTASGLVTLGNNKYTVNYVYIILNQPNAWYVLYGQEEFDNITDATNAGRPALVPPELSLFSPSRLKFKFISKKGVTAFVVIQDYAETPAVGVSGSAAEFQSLIDGGKVGNDQTINIENGTGITIDVSDTDLATTVPANEIDPIYIASQAFNINAGDITNLSNLSGTNTGDQTLTIAGTTSPTIALSGSNTATFNGAGIISLGQAAGTITITGTEVDGSITNELQTLANTSNATSHTVTLSNSGGSTQLVEGSGVSITTTGTGAAGIVTIANTGILTETDPVFIADTVNIPRLATQNTFTKAQTALSFIKSGGTSSQFLKADGSVDASAYSTTTGTVTGVTGTAPVVSSGGVAPAISMPAATAIANGYMTSTYASKLDGIAAGATNVTNNNQITNGAGYTTNVGTVTSVTAGNGMTQSGTATVNPTLNVVSHAGTAGSIGTVNIGADAIGVNLGSTSTTAMRGDNGTTAYNDKINSLAFSGTTTKTLTLTQQDAGTVSNTFTDLVNDADYSTTNELQTVDTLDVSGNLIRLSLSNDGEIFNSVDISTTTAVAANTAKVTMTYPAAGIPLSTGTAWGASITNNSANWNTAYSHTSLTTNPHSVTKTQVGLGSVENAAASTLYEPIFSKNTGFNKNFGSTTGTVLEGRTFGTMANAATGDYLGISAKAVDSDLLDGINSAGFYLAGADYNGDLNSLLTRGSYRVNSTALNLPVGGLFYTLLVSGNNGNVSSQLVTERGTGLTYVRGYNGVAWSAWRTMWTDGNFTPANYALVSALTTHANLTTTAHGLGASAFHADSYFQLALTNPVTGTGTTGYLPKFTGTSTIGNSPIYTNGTNVGIGYSTGTEITNNKFAVNGSSYFNGVITTAATGTSTNWNTAYSHTSLTNNPHSVTKTQVGLGSVENAAASALYVPYTGATGAVNLGAYEITAGGASLQGTLLLGKYGADGLMQFLKSGNGAPGGNFGYNTAYGGMLLSNLTKFKVDAPLFITSSPAVTNGSSQVVDANAIYDFYVAQQRQVVQDISVAITTAIPFNVSNGLDAILAMDVNKIVTFSNLIAGDKGNIYITGDPTLNRTLTIAGYTVEIPAASHSTGDQVALSGAGKNDLLVYWYTGTKLIVGLAKDLQ